MKRNTIVAILVGLGLFFLLLSIGGVGHAQGRDSARRQPRGPRKGPMKRSFTKSEKEAALKEQAKLKAEAIARAEAKSVAEFQVKAAKIYQESGITHLDFHKAKKTKIDLNSGDEVKFDDAKPRTKDANAWAYAPDEDLLAALGYKPHLLKVFEGTAKTREPVLIAQREINQEARSLTYKKTKKGLYLLYAHPKAQKVMVLHGKTLKTLATISLNCAPLSLSVSTNSEDPYVYVLGKEIRGKKVERLNRINLDTLASHAFSIEGLYPQNQSRVLISPDGQRLYFQRGPHVSDFLFSYQIVNTGPNSPPSLRERGSVQFQNSQGVEICRHSGLLSSRKETALPSIEATVQTHEDQPTLHLIDRGWRFVPLFNAFRFEAMQDGALVKRQFFTTLVKNEHRFHTQYTSGTFYSAAHKRIIYAKRGQVLMIDLSRIPNAKKPFLAFQVEKPKDIWIDERTSWKLLPYVKGGTFKIIDAPKGMTLDGDSISWTPTKHQHGRFTFKVQHTIGDESTTRELSDLVGVKALKLGFEVHRSATSPSSRFVALAGDPRRKHEMRFSLGTTVKSKIALLDLKEQRIVFSKQLDNQVTDIRVSHQFLAVSTKQSPKILIFSNATGKLVQTLTSRNNRLGVFVGRDHYLSYDNGLQARTTSDWKLTKDGKIAEMLKPVEIYDVNSSSKVKSNGVPAQGRIGYEQGGVLFDQQSGEARSVGLPAWVIRGPFKTNTSKFRPDFSSYRGNEVFSRWLTPWGAWMHHAWLQNTAGTIREIDHDVPRAFAAMVLPNQPLALAAGGRETASTPTGWNVDLELTFFELRSGKKVHQSRIGKRVIKKVKHDRLEEYVSLFAHANTIAVAFAGEVTFTNPPKLVPADMPMPLHFKYEEGVCRINAKSPEKVKLTLKIEGDLEGLYLSNKKALECVQFKGESPTIEFDRDAIQAAIKGKIKASMESQANPQNNQRTWRRRTVITKQVLMAPYHNALAPRYKAIFGEELAEVVIPISFDVDGENDAGEMIKRPLTIFVEFSRQEIEAIAEPIFKAVEVKRKAAEAVKAMQEAEKEAKKKAAEEAKAKEEKQD